MANFKNKLLRYCYLKHRQQGLTLVELLLVIFIIEILAAFTLPSFLKFVYRAKEVEAQTNIGYLNKGQQIYYMENLSFANSFQPLNYPNEQTENYIYKVFVLPSVPIAIHAAVSKNISLGTRHYGGVVYMKNNQPVTCGPWPFSKPPTVQEILILYYTNCP